MKKIDSLEKQRGGFTIVELLIVIVVIGILAAITIVAYNGITARANAASAQSGVQQATKKVLTYIVQNNDQVPLSLAAAGVNTNSSGTTFQYVTDSTVSPQQFCVSTTVGGVSYYANNSTQTTPSSGTCPINNYLSNPSFETDSSGTSSTGTGAGGVATVSRTNDGINGGWAITQAWSTAATGGGASLFTGTVAGNAAIPISPNVTYTASVYCRVSAAVPMIAGVLSNGGFDYSATPVIVPANTWTRLSVVHTSASTENVAAVACRVTDLSGTTTGFTMKMDQAMLSQGSTLYTYADGNSPGWTWNGTANLSSSKGPAL